MDRNMKGSRGKSNRRSEELEMDGFWLSLDGRFGLGKAGMLRQHCEQARPGASAESGAGTEG